MSDAHKSITDEEWPHVRDYLSGKDPYLYSLTYKGILKRQALQELHDRLLATVDSLKARVGEMEANQRTPNTEEVCVECGMLYRDFDNGDPGANKKCLGGYDETSPGSCPIRSKTLSKG